MYIEDGQGDGFSVGVTKNNQLLTQAENHELQHVNSKEHGRVYQVFGVTPIASGTNTVLHIKNNSSSRLSISYIRIQAIGLSGGGASLPNSDNCYVLGFDTTYVSNGEDATPVNMNRTSSKVADITAKINKPTITGDMTEIDRWYPGPNEDMETFNKHGSIILGQNDTFEIRFVTDNVTGSAYARTTFMYIE